MQHTDDDAAVEEWPVEAVPDEDVLFMRVHWQYVGDDGNLNPGVFVNLPRNVAGSGMSTNWSRYSTAEETRDNPKGLHFYAVISMIVGEVRKIPKQSVVHVPVPTNRSHTEVHGEKDVESRAKFLLASQFAVALPAEFVRAEREKAKSRSRSSSS